MHFLDEHLTYDQAVQLAAKDVEQILAPELRGRLDGIIWFHRLELPELEKVAKRRFARINRTIEPKKLRLEVTDESTHEFCKAYQDSRYGARVILTSLKKTLENELAMAILAPTHIPQDGILHATFDGTSFAVT